MPKYRRKIDIIADILSSTVNGTAKKTWIMYSANLSHGLLEKYLAEILKIGFLRRRDDRYEITERGVMFLKRYRYFMSKYSEVQSSLQTIMSEMRDLEEMCALPEDAKKSCGERKREG